MPGKYEGFAEALAVLKPGGLYLIDDMLPQPNWPAGHAEKVPVLMDEVAKHTDLEMLPLKWASGVVVLVRSNCRL